MKKKFTLLFTIIFVSSILFSSCAKKEEPSVTKENYLLGTIVQLTVYGKNAEAASNKAMDVISDLDDKMSPSKDTSEVSKINKNAGKAFVKVSDDTFTVIKKALEYSSLSNGAFDITVGPLVNLWGIGTDKARVPSPQEIKDKLSLVNYKDVILDENNRSVKLRKPNEAIDLGGIAKGYTADRVKEVLVNEGIKTAFINLGGNIVTLGNKPDGSLWNIGVQDPLQTRGEYFGIVKVSHKSIVSSGNYERYFMKNGKRYHHILDTKTGYPSDNGIIATTIISDKSIDGDALSTTAFVLGLDKGMKLIESLKGVEAIFITKDKKVYTTSGLKDNFKITNQEYIYEKGR
ncbi:Thiamine biosynthesis lipoprotein ApbE precursor [Clostridium liquoris]|uniref:FAD:protein FMN transferase n=1 Tax=Clostridium liquoris TaxID=1289519 RepID=A0A2T0B2L1_9CLOT|nr:FAD:protein FMN transferase [Clostridium liquoris]PRR78129.1 Thiamine biosynthesis lipoprotein ApbE precursor [Clostridium liquoris]